jgi:hypothetical protein
VSLHDQYARLTPFEIAFPDPARLAELSAEVDRESAERGARDAGPEAFMTLVAASDFVRGLRPDDAPAETLIPLGALVFHCVHFLRSGCPLYLLDAVATRRIIAATPHGVPDPPVRAAYLQLPQHLVWMSTAPGGRPESLDGMFWTTAGDGTLHVLPISGLRPDRPGFGAVPLPPAPLADAATWLDAIVRPTGEDFRSTLPGAELDGLHAVEAAGEVLKLLARFFALASSEPHALEHTAPRRGEVAGPRASGLPYTHVALPR